MNIIKIGLVLLTGAGFGVGFDKIADSEILPINQDTPYGHMFVDDEYGETVFCHGDEDIIEHMLYNLSEEDQLLVQAKIDDLLIEYSISIEDLNNDYDLRFDFMNDVMEFLEENDIDYHHRYYNDDEDWHHGMGMH